MPLAAILSVLTAQAKGAGGLAASAALPSCVTSLILVLHGQATLILQTGTNFPHRTQRACDIHAPRSSWKAPLFRDGFSDFTQAECLLCLHVLNTEHLSLLRQE